jgi:DNA-binding MarR family transcriptional regulator
VEPLVKADSAPANDTHERVVQAMRTLIAHLNRAQHVAWVESDLTMGQVRALLVIAQARDPTVGVIAKELGIGLSSASQLVERLVRSGWIERRGHPHDRRVILCSLTKKGARWQQQLLDGLKTIREWLNQMSDDDVQALARGLNALMSVAETAQRKD